MITPIEAYVQQVKECCNCFECASEDQWENAVLTALQNWGDQTCGNWIDDHDVNLRVPLSAQCGGCCPNIFEVNLPETWVQEETIQAKVRVWYGLETKEYSVEWVFDEYTHDLMIDLTSVFDCCQSCLKYDLVIDYVVGTDKIPDSLCRWFCAIAKVYMEIEELQCNSCGSVDDIAVEEVSEINVTYAIKNLALKYFQGVIDEYSLCVLKSLKDWTVGI